MRGLKWVVESAALLAACAAGWGCSEDLEYLRAGYAKDASESADASADASADEATDVGDATSMPPPESGPASDAPSLRDAGSERTNSDGAHVALEASSDVSVEGGDANRESGAVALTDASLSDSPESGDAALGDAADSADAAPDWSLPDPVRPVLACGGTICSDLAILADMEANDGNACTSDGRAGYAMVFNDGTGTQFPQPNGKISQFSPLAECRGTSAVAMHTKGANFTRWGAGVGIHFSNSGWDGSSYTGMSFWAKSPTATTISFGIATRATLDVAFGGTCRPANGKSCQDHFVGLRTLTPEWTLYTVSFNELAQVGWGVPAPTPHVDPTGLMEVDLVFAQGQPFDIWFDDFVFTR